MNNFTERSNIHPVHSQNKPLKVLFLTSQWPSPEKTFIAPFVWRKVESLRKIGVEVEVLHYRGGWKPHRYLKAIWQLRKKLNARSYDLIHAQFAQAGLVAITQRKLPIVVTYGGTDVLGRRNNRGKLTIKGRLQRVVAHIVSRLVAANIVVSQELGRVLGVETDLIPAGIDLELFQPMDRSVARKQLGLPQDKLFALFLGDPQKIWDAKRHWLARDATELAKQRIPNLEFLAVHNRPHSEIPLYMNASDVLLLTSRTEGSPNVLKEALACNLAVVSVDVGDVRERLAGVLGCILCDNDRLETIANAIVAFLTGFKGRIEGRPTVTMLDESSMVRKDIEVYKNVLNI